MRPLPFVWPWALVFWVAFYWSFGTENRYMQKALKGGGTTSKKDAGSFWTVIVGQAVGMFGAFWSAFRLRELAMHPPFLFFWVGVALIIFGSQLRRHCFRMLGEYFTFDVQTRHDQPVIQTGAYRWLRHPAYSGGILMYLGVGFGLGNWASLAFAFVAAFLTYAYRIREARPVAET